MIPLPPPLVSIIIPCHNAAPWLGQCLDSALAQTWPEREVIVVNDGSTDDSGEIARRFASRGVRVFDQANRGAAAARNAGLGAARGEFVQFLDADDLLDARKLEHQMRLIADSGAPRLVSAAWARFRRDPAEAVFSPEPNWRDLSGVEFLRLHFEQGWMMHPAAWLSPRALLDRAGPWNEQLSLNDDGEYFARVMLAAGGIRFCADARSYYRSELPRSLSRRQDGPALESLWRSFELMIGHLTAADSSPRTSAAAAAGWKWLAFELYPGRPDLARRAEERCAALGGSSRPLPAGPHFQRAARLLGWRGAKRLRDWWLRRQPSRR